jgi:hypothetical protein
MSGIRLIMLGLAALAATVAVGAFASAAASAHKVLDCLKVAAGTGKYEESKCTKGPGSKEWERFEIASQKISGTGGVSTLKTTLAGAEIIVTCKKAGLTGEIETAGTGKGDATLEECSLGNSHETFSSCEVPNTSFELSAQLVGSPVELEFKPASGSTFVEVTIKNKAGKTCVEKGTYSIDGTQDCVFSNGETFEVKHEVDCKAAGSHLTFDGNTATFEGDKSIEMGSGDSWAVE